MNSGYPLDVAYTSGFYGELSPVFLNYIAALNGFSPVETEAGFDYCELGCGRGVTAAALAQVFGQGRFVALDLNPEHVAEAASLADEAGLGNLSFLERDFDALDPSEFPDFDFIVLHGVYSWIDPERRNAVREFIHAKLKPGGLAYVSYDALPGWAALAPLREAVVQHTLPMTTDSVAKAQAGLDYLDYLKENKAAFLEDNPPAKAFIDELKRQDLRYVAHEFFGDFVKPYYFAQVAGEMRSIGLRYAGSAQINLNFIDLAAPAEFHGHLRKSPTRNAFETQGDFIRNQRFRKDVFKAGEPDLTEDTQRAALSAMIFGATHAAAAFRREVQFGEVKLTFAAELFSLVFEALDKGAASIAELAARPALAKYGVDFVVRADQFLTAGGQVMPFARATSAPAAKALAAERYALPTPFNLASLKRHLFDGEALALAAPAAGIGLEVSMADALIALCSVEAPRGEVADWAFQRCIEADRQMVSGDDDESAALAEAVEAFRDTRLAKFLEFGILEPAS